MKLSEKLIKLRKEKGLSQEEFGNEINVSRQAISKWENDETKPDIEKIQEIVKRFDISFEYLLNDEIESDKNVSKTINKVKKSKRKVILKIILILFAIYLLTCVYKFIAFYRFYLVANSFSEENYSMSEAWNSSSELNGKYHVIFNTKKVGNKLLETSYAFEDDALKNMNVIKDDTGTNMPFSITYTDIDKNISYNLDYDVNDKSYFYKDKTENELNEKKQKILENEIKNTTLSTIPSGFKEIFLASINPLYCYVDIINGKFIEVSPIGKTQRITNLTKDGLVESVYFKTEYQGLYTVLVSFGYDYVQDHFEEIKNPLENFSNMVKY